ncbi:hypothetical protein [Flavobacterium gawalongense]|uniref:Uncharacterized protein n=1 Tax=Flavobacterium gawalongense TaxID=2594432 RepID=A0A553BBF2_9FLAO|nr:hypothetical protein [Flavobacterium gawalongense]TRX01392.1 hypothetical protein FNW33_09780 [Flavobacterium gawalongense]TRX05581.1 hypothetical protein FNW11_15990 [Flavobacterium gawalongense]TRX05916.1 hypothetical protein FNW12_09865 [Flavobacterium gawalongense]TRX06422.1 hypothetical protein FNW10_16045 [Flavobacterium gawalongense]TRX22345.1 hypothetical protein FNW38_16085 [Flavobacterium gawalongense]
MARQKGIIKLKGTIGDITFYKTKDGHLAREKGGIDANRIANDPAFQRTRENGSEFGRAGKAGKTLRTALRTLLLNSADNRMVSRLTQAMVKVIQADMTNERGLRNVIDGEAELLIGFEFNIGGKLGTTLFAPFVAAIDRISGDITVDIVPFVPANMIAAPSGTTHFKIISAGVEIDFETEKFVVASSESDILPWDSNPTADINHINSITPDSVSPLFLALGVEFYQEVNGRMYPLKNGSYNPLSLVQVSGL